MKRKAGAVEVKGRALAEYTMTIREPVELGAHMAAAVLARQQGARNITRARCSGMPPGRARLPR